MSDQTRVKTLIPDGVTPGKILFVSGTTHSTCQRFTVNLVRSSEAGDDIALHFDVRVRISGEIHRIIRNSQVHGHWGVEEYNIPYFPFQPNSNFEIMILAEEDKFKIAVNNNHFTEFRHRVRPLNEIDSFVIFGDVSVSQMRVQ